MIIKIWHRGACWYAPENTLKSFKKVIDLWIKNTELDIHLSKDWKIVVIHDDSLERTTNWIWKITNFNYEHLKKLNVLENEKIPLLSEVLDLLWKNITINIELKGKGTPKVLNELFNDYIKNKWWNKNNFMVSSFDFKLLSEFKKINNHNIRVSILLESLENIKLDELLLNNYYSINLYYRIITKDIVKQIHGFWKKVFVYTVNNLDTINSLKKIWVDWIFSDYPDRI